MPFSPVWMYRVAGVAGSLVALLGLCLPAAALTWVVSALWERGSRFSLGQRHPARPRAHGGRAHRLQQRLFKTGGRLIRHARYFILQLAESPLTPTLFRQILGRIERLAGHPT